MTELSNTLADLAERVRAAAEASRTAEIASAEKAIEAGLLLCDAKDTCRHGEWLPFLNRAGVNERHAQRLMQLARSGLNPTAVSDLGGVRGALGYLTSRRLPEPGQCCLVGRSGWEGGDDRSPVAFIYPSPDHAGYFDVQVFDPQTGKGEEIGRPVRGEPVRQEDGSFFFPVWRAIDELLDVPIPEREFKIVLAEDLEDDCPFLSDPEQKPGTGDAMPSSYLRAVAALQHCEAEFSPQAFLAAASALATVLKRMEYWPDDPRMFPVFNRIAGEETLTRLAKIVGQKAIADAQARRGTEVMGMQA